MSRILKLEIPDDIYEALLKYAQEGGQSPEDTAKRWLTLAAQNATGDRLLRWAGAFTSEVTDVAQRHDFYIGQALHDELQGNQHG
jgi:hypothetical protein